MGKMILVRLSKHGRLVPATAIDLDGRSNTVMLDRDVSLDGQKASNVVPAETCYEFDAEVMTLVNNLVTDSADKISAAEQICDSSLLSANFNVQGDLEQVVTH
jgi:hypothetical protein